MSAWLSEGFRVAINAPWKLVEVGGTSYGIAEVEEGEGCVFGECCSQVGGEGGSVSFYLKRGSNISVWVRIGGLEWARVVLGLNLVLVVKKLSRVRLWL